MKINSGYQKQNYLYGDSCLFSIRTIFAVAPVCHLKTAAGNLECEVNSVWFLMTDILTLVFRTLSSQTGQNKDPSSGPPSPAPRSSTLVVGEHRLSRSVLLLAAVTAASELGVRVAFFAQTQIQSLPECLQRCSAIQNPEGLKVNQTTQKTTTTTEKNVVDCILIYLHLCHVAATNLCVFYWNIYVTHQQNVVLGRDTDLKKGALNKL